MPTIAIPLEDNASENSMISAHFGRAPFYGIISNENDSVEIIQNESNHFGGTISPVQYLIKKGTKIVICKSLGKHALEQLHEENITVLQASANTLMGNLNLFKEDKLTEIGDSATCNCHTHSSKNNHK